MQVVSKHSCRKSQVKLPVEDRLVHLAIDVASPVLARLGFVLLVRHVGEVGDAAEPLVRGSGRA